MSDVDQEMATTEAAVEAEQSITFRVFLEQTHPSVFMNVLEFWTFESSSSGYREILYPDVRLHCRKCEGERTFRSDTNNSFVPGKKYGNAHPFYQCGDCQVFYKEYALHFEFGTNGGGRVYKYGEIPAFGIPVPNRVLRLFGKVDAELFTKGRQCENLGYGIAAFAYYRRVVENHRNDLFDEIIKACETVGSSAELIKELNAAKKEISFSKSMEKVKSALPDGLLISGHNPLNALHKALSVGLHKESDEVCLEYAQSVRLVLADLVDRIALLKQENKQLEEAVQRLLNK